MKDERKATSVVGVWRELVVIGAVASSAFGLGACDDKKTETTEPSATAAATVAPTPPPMPPPSASAALDEAPKKHELKDCKPGKVVDFDGNTALEANIRLKLTKPEGDIMVSDLAKVRSVNVSQARTDELDVCIYPHFTGLKELFLGAGKLDDLSPIAGLHNIESLRASLNHVADVKPLAQMTKMDRLDLGHTMITDLTPLKDMVGLTDLQIDDTLVSDLTPLANCKNLERLSIQRTAVKSLAPLKEMTKLKFLYVSGAPIEDKPVLSPLVAKGLKIIDE
jgi:internalin A